MTRAYGVAQNDTGKPLIAEFSYDDPSLGSLSDLVTMATSVVVVIKNRDTGDVLVDRGAAQVLSSASGNVTLSYIWGPGKTATPGRYAATFEAATIAGPVTLPTGGEIIPVTIRPDLG